MHLAKQLNSFKITTKVWLYPGDAAWHFVTIDKDISDDIRKAYIWPRRGFGAIPVKVKIGAAEWKTSVFPEKTGTYILPLKKAIRLKEDINVGDTLSFELMVLN